ncbi:MAG: hypothetical protein AAGI71_17555 [Bacteroidota bacterium]
MSTTRPPHRPRTAVEVNAAGIKALIDALGVADAARFLQQYGPGLGNYTAKREELLGRLSMKEAQRLGEEMESSQQA